MSARSKNEKNSKNFLLKFIYTAEKKNICILHGHVFVMRKVAAPAEDSRPTLYPCVSGSISNRSSLYIMLFFGVVNGMV